MERRALDNRPRGYGARRQKGNGATRATQPKRHAHQWAHDGLHDHLSQQEIVLTDGWSYEKVVVGSNLRAEVRMKSGRSIWAKY